RQISRWGRPLGADAGVDPSGFGVSNGALRSSATAIGAAATALAIVVPIFIPTFGLEMFSGGFGQGGGNQIKIVHPTTARLPGANRFSDNEWSSGDRTASGDQIASGELPPPSGMDTSVPTREF